MRKEDKKGHRNKYSCIRRGGGVAMYNTRVYSKRYRGVGKIFQKINNILFSIIKGKIANQGPKMSLN